MKCLSFAALFASLLATPAAAQDDITQAGGTKRNATSFAVYRQLAKTVSVNTGRTFYSSGDPLDVEVTVRNLSNRRVDNLRVEFGPYQYPWIARQADRMVTI